MLSGKMLRTRSAKTSEVEGRSSGSSVSVPFAAATPFPGFMMTAVAVPIAALRIFMPKMKARVMILVTPCSLGFILAITGG